MPISLPSTVRPAVLPLAFTFRELLQLTWTVQSPAFCSSLQCLVSVPFFKTSLRSLTSSHISFYPKKLIQTWLLPPSLVQHACAIIDNTQQVPCPISRKEKGKNIRKHPQHHHRAHWNSLQTLTAISPSSSGTVSYITLQAEAEKKLPFQTAPFSSSESPFRTAPIAVKYSIHISEK